MRRISSIVSCFSFQSDFPQPSHSPLTEFITNIDANKIAHCQEALHVRISGLAPSCCYIGLSDKPRKEGRGRPFVCVWEGRYESPRQITRGDAAGLHTLTCGGSEADGVTNPAGAQEELGGGRLSEDR